MSLSPKDVTVVEAPLIKFPGATTFKDGVQNAVDCNSPSFWNGDQLVLFNSYGQPWRIAAPDVFHLGPAEATVVRGELDGHRLSDLFIWVESIVVRPGGRLYGFFHYEPDGVCKPGEHLPTAPRVLALRSLDLGRSWDFQGVVLEAPPDSTNCDTRSPWDSGGHGDFSVIPDRKGEYLYILFTSYVRRPEEQGVGVARLRVADLDNPVGNVRKWMDGAWTEPGVGGHFSPRYPSRIDWHRDDADIHWGPSIHWNTHLERYVILMSRAVDTKMTGDGTWMFTADDLEDPASWGEPVRIIPRERISSLTAGGRVCNGTTHGWYPQVMGVEPGGTDTQCGRVGRLFLSGVSNAEIHFG